MNAKEFLSHFDKHTPTTKGVLVKCPGHEDSKASLQVYEGSDGKILLHCFAGCTTATVLAAMNLTLKDLFPDKKVVEKFRAPVASAPTVKPKLVKAYDYRDAFGRLVYQACRLDPKSFRQRRPNPKFDATQPESRENQVWKFDMEGVTRVLYNLPEVLKANLVVLTEGEKDADNVRRVTGMIATCNVGGAGKWLEAYTDSLEGKEVVICGDNDEPGKKHVDLVFESIAGKVKSARVIKLPDSVKDVSDFFEQKGEKAAEEFGKLFDAAQVFHKGLRVPVYSMAEIEPAFENFVERFDKDSVPLSRWLPKLAVLDPLMGGDVVLIIGGTGVAKTALAQNIVMNVCLPSSTLFFEIELTLEKMFRRFVQIRQGMTRQDVMEMYRQKAGPGKMILEKEFANLVICPQSKLSTSDIERIINQSALKIGEAPKNVVIDYAQLIKSEGNSRYERASNVAEELKVIAKACDVRMFLLSQVGRPPKEDSKEAARGVGLYDAKESGSLENSCALALGIWRDPRDQTLLNLRVLKATEGGAGLVMQCHFDGATMQISQREEQASTND